MTSKRGFPVLLAAIAALPVFFALLAVPVWAQAPSVIVTSPETEAVVEGLVTFNGTAHDPGGRLKEVRIAIEGASDLTVNIPGNKADATWETNWDSTAVPDGQWNASVTASNKGGNISAPVNLTFIVDNDKEPRVEALQVLFDAGANGTYAPWDNATEMPTTRLSFELTFGEEMNKISLQDGVAFVGGASTWDLARNGSASYWVNVSYLEANTSYNFTVGSPGADLAGNAVESFGFLFQTAAEPTPGTPEPPGEPGDPDEPGDPGEPSDPDEPGGPGEPGGGFNLPLPFSLDSPWPWLGAVAVAVAVALVVAHRKGFLVRREEPEPEPEYETEYEWQADEDDEPESEERVFPPPS